MESINFILCIVYLALGIFNIAGVITIENSDIFGMTVGTLFLCIAPLFEKKSVRVIYYILSAGFIVGFHLYNGANEFVKNFDGNSWLLLSLSVAFLANYLSKVKSDKLKIQDRSKELKSHLNEVKLLKEEINKLRLQRDNKNKN